VAVLPLRAEHAGKAASWRRIVVSFSVAGRLAGFISVFGRAGSDRQDVRLALNAAALAASIEALRRHAATEAQSGALSSLVGDWVAGRFERGDEVVATAQQLGQVLQPPYAVLVIERSGRLQEEDVRRLARAVAGGASTGPIGATGPGKILPLQPVLPGQSALPVEESRVPLWTVVDQTRTTVLVPLADDVLLESSTEAVHEVLRTLVTASPNTLGLLSAGGTVSARGAAPGAGRAGTQGNVSAGDGSEGSFAGIGRVATEIGDVPNAYRDALQALAVARRLGGRHRVAYFATLGVYRVLAAVEPASELASFCADVLGPLRAHDLRSGGDLLRTLEAYLLSGGSPQLTAERLHTHRNTVLYRLERIQRALGVDLRQPERQLTLHLALRAAEVLGEARFESEPSANVEPKVSPRRRKPGKEQVFVREGAA